jgi:predicted enzyme related to lactoylglutathione lyase
MLEDQRPGAAYWIDHYVVPTADVPRWSAFYENVLGAVTRVDNRPRRTDRPAGLQFTDVGKCHVGGLPFAGALAPVGVGPRYSWFIRPEEIEEHLRRLDANGVTHSGPIRTNEEGEDGTAIRFVDPDGNPLEFWAPAQMPDGAMNDESAQKVGRVAVAAFESRDLAKTTEFYSTYCGLDPLRSGDVAADTVVLPLAAGGRLVFKKVEKLGLRTGGHGIYRACHTALVVRDDEFMSTLDRMYEDLPEWDYDPNDPPPFSPDEAEAMPARTGIHGNPGGPEWKRLRGRGDSFYDWDTNVYHFVAAKPVGGSMATFESVSQRTYLEQLRASEPSA